MGRDGDPVRRPFQAPTYDLGPAPSGEARGLSRLRSDEARRLGAAFAAIDPWRAYGISPVRLADFLAMEEVGCCRLGIRIAGTLAGAVVVRSPWLHGPYLQFLGLLPGAQGHGHGGAILDWMAQEAPPGTRNLWLCVSASNIKARAFYERHGYTLAATLPALAADHMDEVLMRRRIGPAV